MKRPLRRLAAVLLAAAVAAAIAVAAGSAAKSGSSKSQASKGGVLRVGWENNFNDMSDSFDPTGEYLGDAFGIYTNLLIRTLVSYNHVPGAAGNKVVPDIATSIPRPTNGGKTYTFHIRPGVKFSPPVNRAVTSHDFVTAFQRLAKPNAVDGAEYAFYYNAIQGFQAYGAGKAKTISGIKTPNNSTIVFNLTQPVGDFLMRISMPATGPMPAEVTKCFEGQPGKYGRDIIATAGYMFKGLDQVNISSCKTIKPASGFDGQTIMDLVRNPNYDQKTDPARKNYPDEVQFIANSNANDIYNRIGAGQLDLAVSSIPPQVLQRYASSSSLRSHLFVNGGDRTWFLTMNLTQAPFDDIHVRKAMNWIIDKAALIQAWGGPLTAKPANHIVPDSIFNNQLAEYAPYKTPGDHGSLAKAKAAMKGSKYDTNHDGTCSASQCKNVLMIADVRQTDPKMVPVIVDDAKKIGITFTVRSTSSAYPTIQTPSKNIPFGERPGWGKDFADAETFFAPLFDGRTIIPSGNVNYPLVGATPAQCKKLGVTGNCNNLPSVNSQIDKCGRLIGQPRLTCYEGLDKYLMTKVVPWIPWNWANVVRITSDNVTHYQFDQFSTTPAYQAISVK